MNNESVGKKIVEALKKQAEIIDTPVESDTLVFDSEEVVLPSETSFAPRLKWLW